MVISNPNQAQNPNSSLYNHTFNNRSYFPTQNNNGGYQYAPSYNGFGENWRWNRERGWNFYGDNDAWLWGTNDWWNSQSPWGQDGLWINVDGNWMAMNGQPGYDPRYGPGYDPRYGRGGYAPGYDYGPQSQGTYPDSAYYPDGTDPNATYYPDQGGTNQRYSGMSWPDANGGYRRAPAYRYPTDNSQQYYDNDAQYQDVPVQQGPPPPQYQDAGYAPYAYQNQNPLAAMIPGFGYGGPGNMIAGLASSLIGGALFNAFRGGHHHRPWDNGYQYGYPYQYQTYPTYQTYQPYQTYAYIPQHHHHRRW
jgi:hypothetical protein